MLYFLLHSTISTVTNHGMLLIAVENYTDLVSNDLSSVSIHSRSDTRDVGTFSPWPKGVYQKPKVVSNWIGALDRS